MFIDQGHPVTKIIRFAGIKSSTWYKRQQGPSEDGRKNNKGRPCPGFSFGLSGEIVLDSAIVSALKSLRKRKYYSNAGGYRKLSKVLRREFSFVVNRKKVYRLCKEHELLLPKKKKRKRQGKKRCSNEKVTGPNQLWQFDIKYGYIDGENRFFFLMAFIDTFKKKIVGYHVGTSCKAQDMVFALDWVIRVEAPDLKKLRIRSDNGTQMTSNKFKNYIDFRNVEHEFRAPSSPNQNAYIESFFSIVETELLQHSYFETFGDAYKEVVEFMRHYHRDRLHGSLNYLSPVEFENDWMKKKRC